MTTPTFNLYLIGVGGQGIGLLSAALVRAADLAGYAVRGVDTHGLAQRGGRVVSNLRLGPGAHSPLVMPGHADLVVALERHEAVAGGAEYLKENGVLVYYDAIWQPLDVRLRRAESATEADVERVARARAARLVRVLDDSLSDARMQNVVILATLARERLIPEVEPEHFIAALSELLKGSTLEANLGLFNQHLAG